MYERTDRRTDMDLGDLPDFLRDFGETVSRTAEQVSRTIEVYGNVVRRGADNASRVVDPYAAGEHEATNATMKYALIGLGGLIVFRALTRR